MSMFEVVQRSTLLMCWIYCKSRSLDRLVDAMAHETKAMHKEVQKTLEASNRKYKGCADFR